MVTATADNMTIKYFDTLEYVKESKRIEDRGDLAEYQVKQIEAAIERAVQYVQNDRKDLVTKNDIKDFATKNDIMTLQKELTNLRYDTLKFIVWTGVTAVSILGGMIAHGFHWL